MTRPFLLSCGKEAYTHGNSTTVDGALATLPAGGAGAVLGDLYQRTREAWQRFLEAASERERDGYLEGQRLRTAIQECLPSLYPHQEATVRFLDGAAFSPTGSGGGRVIP